MANVFDVAKYILSKQDKITGMKLQKLCYYSQAWSLVWDEAPLFANEIQAWGRGPVCPDLYDWHQGKFMIESDETLKSKCMNNLTDAEQKTIDAVLRDYGKFTAQELSDLTHTEAPWVEANGKCTISAMCDQVITLEAMHEYYSNIPKEHELNA